MKSEEQIITNLICTTLQIKLPPHSMNIIIPLGGRGERFSKNGYVEPKPLIPIFEKTMIEYAIDNLNRKKDDHIYIFYNNKLDAHEFSYKIREKYPEVRLTCVPDTKGAAETLSIGLRHVMKQKDHHKKCLVVDCDTFYTEDIVSMFREKTDNTTFYTLNYETKPIYSYIETDKDESVVDIKEKVKISDKANAGAYAFTDIQELCDFCDHVVNNNITFNNEPYTSCVISEMVKKGIVFKGCKISSDCVVSLGTPDAVTIYKERTRAFLFDLDGTLVKTDDIYFKVWSDILTEFNLVLTNEIFTNYIQGNNDKYIVETLLKNVDVCLDDLSRDKDNLFIKHISSVHLIEGVNEILKQIKADGHKACIVTNCNRHVAEAIITYVDIAWAVDFIVSGQECMHGKPNVEPYKKALDTYHISSQKCIVFEDSKSGLLSGKQIHPLCLIGIETIYDSATMKRYGVDMSIKDYVGVSIRDIMSFHKSSGASYLRSLIFSTTDTSNVKYVCFDAEKLKGGFIADVVSFQVVTHNNTIHHRILKYENTEENNLSSMATKIQLYQREYYFYTNISPFVNVCIPKFHHLVVDNAKSEEPIGIVLENLLTRNLVPNLTLSEESVDVTLKIVDRMASMHAHFWDTNLASRFPDLKKSTDPIFCPFYTTFIEERYASFGEKWFSVLTESQKKLSDDICKNFSEIQKRMDGEKNQTFIHGDIKSPNIFYDKENGCEPYFIDWQHCAIGKGVQDLVFFVVESFDISDLIPVFNLAVEYYYKKLKEYGVVGYSRKEFEDDLYFSLCYVPFFTSIWFGTTPQDELIDANFPYFFITKMFHLIEFSKNNIFL